MWPMTSFSERLHLPIIVSPAERVGDEIFAKTSKPLIFPEMYPETKKSHARFIHSTSDSQNLDLLNLKIKTEQK